MLHVHSGAERSEDRVVDVYRGAKRHAMQVMAQT